MEKTIQIIIAKTSFLCTQEAFDRLSAYLEQMKQHFAHEEGSDEIMHDIESRIAEKLLEEKTELITLSHVQSVIAEIGEVSELDDATPEDMASEAELPRRLYRNPDTAVIGGVASGIATYFNTNPLFIRLLFVLSVFFGGTGIVLYVLLWVLIPEARTSAQKLQMHGKPVTFEAIRQMVQTRGDESDTAFLRRIPLFIHGVVSKVLRFFSAAFGIMSILGAFFGIIGLTTFAGVVLTNWNTPLNDIPFRAASSEGVLLVAMAAGYIAVLIPLIFVFTLGFRLLRARSIFPATIEFGLIGIWALALIVGGTAGFKIASDYYTYVQTDPAYAVHSETLPLEPFDRIVVAEGASVSIAHGEAHQATIEGRQTAIEEVQLTVKDGVLTVGRKRIETACFFCDTERARVTIASPALQTIEVDRSRVSFTDYTAAGPLTLEINDGSVYGDLSAPEVTLDSKSGHMQGRISAPTLTLNAVDSWFDLRGETETLTLTLLQTSFYAESLVAQNATVELIDSTANVLVRGNLTETVDDDSELIVSGQPVPKEEEPEEETI